MYTVKDVVDHELAALAADEERAVAQIRKDYNQYRQRVLTNAEKFGPEVLALSHDSWVALMGVFGHTVEPLEDNGGNDCPVVVFPPTEPPKAPVVEEKA